MQTENSTELTSLVEKLDKYQEIQVKTSNPSSPPPSSSSEYSSIQESKEKESREPSKEKKFNLDEKYFHHKLQHLLNVPKKFSFTNAEIKIKDFIQDIKMFIDENVKNSVKLDTTKQNMIKKEIEETLENEKKIELDSFFAEVSGMKIKKFLDSIKDYSFPSKDEEINENEKYIVLVESTHSLDSNIIKKTEQLRKYYLFFSLLIRCLKNYKDYLGLFEDYLIGKYFEKLFSDKNEFNELSYKAEFSFLNKIIILIATDQTLPNFVELTNRIETSQAPINIKDDVKKCFPTIYEIEKKKIFKDEITIDNDSKPKKKNLSEKEKKQNYIKKKEESIQLINFLMNKINEEKTCIVKIIYFDLYLNLIEPGYSISESLKNINKTISTEISKLQLDNTELNNKNLQLKRDVENLKNDNLKLSKEIGERKDENLKLSKEVEKSQKKINKMLIFLKEQFPEKDFSDFMEE